jgi:hypothetical protein
MVMNPMARRAGAPRSANVIVGVSLGSWQQIRRCAAAPDPY